MRRGHPAVYPIVHINFGHFFVRFLRPVVCIESIPSDTVAEGAGRARCIHDG